MNDSTYFEYPGSELEVFRGAKRWRAYWMSFVKRHLGQSNLEVGAGTGTITESLALETKSWTAIEPDGTLFAALEENLRPYSHVQTINCLLGELESALGYDTILYIDVLEHIEEDRHEVIQACSDLNPGGKLIILVPAHQSLFSAFDASIGHYRRYNQETLDKLRPPEMNMIFSRYLDSVGFALSWANAKILSQSTPTKTQITLWDRCVIPVSRLLDRLLGYRFGKSLLVVWQAPMVEN